MKRKTKDYSPGYLKNESLEPPRPSEKEKPKMTTLTKTFEQKEMLAFSQLRTLTQKDLISSFENNNKIGIVIKDQLRVAMLDMAVYENLVEQAAELERLTEVLEEQEFFMRTQHRLDGKFEELPEGTSLRNWADLR
ncbi:hypothetical protein EJP82_26780 [Paenibacillus anaericanus]|uniref:Uncharacterized protein n=1 Tax=Paenibacillus anaericanus TaxID=170367 RepID=A0A3S1BEB8_9BACL|nr:hypothetical protein [Paenibacillus anaericanus]RUT38721.1 hypothetical protein EJP82_26780 [Paenibacillus anaericanus]